MKSIPKHLINDKTFCVNFLSFVDLEGVRRFMYIAVRGDKMPEFEIALRRGQFDTEDFGFVLEEGVGQPSDLLKAKMEFLYECDHRNPLHVYNPPASAAV